MLANGAMLIDTPGMREFGLGVNENTDLGEQFPVIEAYAQNCRFSDCTHTNENKCAVLDALDEGSLDPDIYDNYMKLKKEKEFFEKSNVEKRRLDKKRGKMYKEHIQFSKKRKG